MNKIIITSVFLSVLFVLALSMPGIVQAQYNCISNYQQKCLGNNLYWYDSCGNQQNFIQYCSGSNSYNNYNNYNYNNNYNNNNNCSYHASEQCSGNSVYFYSGCDTIQDLIQNCTISGLTCQYGQNGAQCAVASQLNSIAANTYVAHSTTACKGNDIHWFDSLRVESGLYKTCADTNTCTLDTCSADKCSNTLKCDGSTCAAGSADYNTYCATAQTGTTTTVPTTTVPTTSNTATSGTTATAKTSTNSN
jgi:hypothetical protein